MTHSQEASSPNGHTNATAVFSHFRPYARSKAPALALSSLFAVSAFLPPTLLRPNAYFPPYLHRVGFSVIFGGAAYVLSTEDVRNGSGITTAWSLTYLVLHLKKSLGAPRHPLTLAMSGGAAGCAALYGTEYFMYQS
ncbi:hypothetical protein PAXRUDRAFT_32603 [Paxillus rubicundulus Ve08.2h10]|uniref:Altered inheritance of mitochondria protein 19 n=1 Tax=Paxillus rubicundulus Ve08.2h10 TaxID=930991 RepID=A0A0D0E9V5_9AGAM|nr:hypothetical protein PAXRUDRAFT_32603 [Paxillus rubicundulus Ve08.2h10]